MKKFLATLLLAAVMLTGASFCVEYEPAAALEPVVTPVHAVAEQVNLTEKRADIPQPVVSKPPVVQPEEPMEEPDAVTLTQEEIDLIKKYAFAVNDLLRGFMKKIGIDLVDFKLEFGKTADGTIVLADEISPDTCRLWDEQTHEKLDKDRFRRDMGGAEEAYEEVMRRLMGDQ